MNSSNEQWLARAGMRVSDWFEHWFPDAYSFAIVAVAIVFVGSVAVGNSPVQTAVWFGAGFWELVKFTMQMTLIIVTGYTLATAPPVYRIIERLAGIPKKPATAVAFITLFSMVSSLLSWSFSLIFSGFLVREVAYRVKGTDYRAAGAAAYLGISSVSMMGLSSSAALIMANPASMPPALLKISGKIPLDQTIFLWQGWVVIVTLIAVSIVIAYGSTPSAEHARDMESMGIEYRPPDPAAENSSRPGEWLEYHPLLTIILGLIGVAYLWDVAANHGAKELLDLNNYIFCFLIASIWLHWRPRSFMQAVNRSVPAASGVLIQYPLYAGMLKIMTESGLAVKLARFFVEISSHTTYPLLVGVYSAILGFFIPSAGGKWLIEAPYVMQAAITQQVHLGWVVQIYNAAEALPSMIHPFWMLPLIGILNLRARDLVGYCAIQFVVHVPLVLLLCWALSFTLPYIPPVLP